MTRNRSEVSVNKTFIVTDGKPKPKPNPNKPTALKGADCLSLFNKC